MPLVQLTAQVPTSVAPSPLEPSMLMSLAGRHQPPPFTRVSRNGPIWRPLRYKYGRPADSAYITVFDKPSVISAKRDVRLYANMPRPGEPFAGGIVPVAASSTKFAAL